MPPKKSIREGSSEKGFTKGGGLNVPSKQLSRKWLSKSEAIFKEEREVPSMKVKSGTGTCRPVRLTAGCKVRLREKTTSSKSGLSHGRLCHRSSVTQVRTEKSKERDYRR